MTDAARGALEYLNKSGIDYTFAAHESVSSIAECQTAAKLLGGIVPRNLFLTTTNKSRFFLLLAHPESVFRTSSVSKQASSSRLSFAGEDSLKLLLNTHPGAVSPLGLIFDREKRVGLLIDRRLMNDSEWIFHPLDNTMSVKMKRDDFLSILLKSLGRTPLFVDMDK